MKMTIYIENPKDFTKKLIKNSVKLQDTNQHTKILWFY